MTMFHVFAYGSLIFSPELPEELAAGTRAVIEGHHRAFNKRSGPRACTRDHRAHPELESDLPPAFRRPFSLALGTEPGGRMEGVVLSYPDTVRDAVTLRLDAREGVWPDRPEHTWSYLPTVVQVHCADGRTLEALTYLSNPTGDWHASGLSPALVARILLHATPRTRGARALGAEYLLDTAAALRSLGIHDPGLEDLVALLPEALQARAAEPAPVGYIS